MGRGLSAAVLLGALAAWLPGMQGLASADETAAAPAGPPPAGPAAAMNSLTPAEKASGWRLLFDGLTPLGWRGYCQSGFPTKGWSIRDGMLVSSAGGGGGDLVTEEEFGDFELALEYRCAPKANSGIMFRVDETLDAPWQTGPEFQILDDAGLGLTPDHPHSAAALYDLAAPAAGKVSKPAGEWNRARIMLRDGRLRHWLNDVKVVDIRVDGEEWARMIAGSKFKSYPGFGVLPKGHIALQDHGDEVAYRNIKLRAPGAAMPGEQALFNGRDLRGWTAHLLEGATVEEVWKVENGVLVCAGKPAGYLRTEGDHENFVLKLEWRWPEGKQPGNSGVLVRKVGEDKVWPKSVEAQLHSGSAGDFWCIDEFPMRTAPERLKGRNTRRSHTNENPIGSWNEYEIVVDGDQVILLVNGEVLNQAWDVQELPGSICLQSEGAEIHFRNIRLAPIER
jgi:hypothetical protein